MYDDDSESVSGAKCGRSPVYSRTAQRIDEEVRSIIDDCYDHAKHLIVENINQAACDGGCADEI